MNFSYELDGGGKGICMGAMELSVCRFTVTPAQDVSLVCIPLGALSAVLAYTR